jgi:hypothetical protein
MKTQITNQNLFEAKQVQVDLQVTGKSYNVSVSWIEEGQRLYQEWDGEFGRKDFEESFGFQLAPDSSQDEALNVWTYFVGTEDEAVEFAKEWESMLDTKVSASLMVNDPSGLRGWKVDNAWLCTASVTKAQIDEFNMDQDWVLENEDE